ncbi:DnaD domain protein [Lactobacillus kunkeei]|nr:DnaD domain protein [Apilactobacillus kunkeei]
MENNETTPKYFIQVQMQTLKGLGLNSTDKLVYGTIYTMLNVTGKCFMSNAAIAEGLELKPKTVSKSVSKLAGVGLLNVKLIYKEDSKQIDKRYITLSDYSGGGMLQKSHRVSDKNSIPMLQKSEGNRLPNRLDEYISSSSGDDFVDEKPVNNQAFTSYEKLWGFPNAIAREDLTEWIKNYSDELVNYAIEIAGHNNVSSRGANKYLEAIITAWKNADVTTVEAAKKQNEEHNNRIDREFKSRKSYNKRPNIKETLPDWAKDDYKPKEYKQSNKYSRDELKKKIANLQNH